MKEEDNKENDNKDFAQNKNVEIEGLNLEDKGKKANKKNQ